MTKHDIKMCVCEKYSLKVTDPMPLVPPVTRAVIPLSDHLWFLQMSSWLDMFLMSEKKRKKRKERKDTRSKYAIDRCQ